MSNQQDVLVRLQKLREAMKESKVDYALFTTADYHGSEYVSDYFKVREYFSGFTGSNGDLLVWQEGAGLWTDGRYFVQAEKELQGTDIALYRMGVEGVPTITEFLKTRLQPGETLGLDGKTFSSKFGKSMERLLEEKKGSFSYDLDFAEKLWENRPLIPANEAYALSAQVAGKTVEEKLDLVRKAIKEKQAEGLFISKLDDIMWLFNIRGWDVECNPVALSYAYITAQTAVLFLQDQAVTTKLFEYLAANHVIIKKYGSEVSYIKECREQKILVDERFISYFHYKELMGKCLKVCENPTELLKARKSKEELEHIRDYYLRDSVAVTKFLYWLKCEANIEELTELDAARYLDQLRSEIPGYLELSFPTISAYGPNAAMMHYEATEASHAKLQSEGFLLVDSGGQYLGATTDVTRTITLGKLSQAMKKHYTYTAVGMIRLANATFLEGCTGRNLDILARELLWAEGIDYRCGTGHGVGYILNVHEGPQGIRWRPTQKEAALEPGMLVTDEPGVYLEGKYGIRIENVLAVKEKQTNEYGRFLAFENLTWVPLDYDALEAGWMTEGDRELVNRYQMKVYDILSPFLTIEECKWLKEETKPI